MKSAIYCSVFALSTTLGLTLQEGHRGLSEDLDALSRALALVESSRAGDRISGFEQLGELWNLEPRPSYLGFSDTPVETARKPEQKPELSDASIDRIARAIQSGLADEDSKVREAAAVAICSAPRPRPEVISALTSGLNSNDGSVTWYVAQKAEEFPPPIDSVIHSLIANLGSDDFSNYYSASDMLKVYGPQAGPYADRILDAVLQSKTDRELKMYVLRDIEIKGAAAEKLAAAAKDLTWDELGTAAIALLEQPQLLKQIEAECPETIPALQEQMGWLYSYLCQHQSESNETRAWLAASDQLLPATMGLLQEERFIPRITAAEASANSYEKTMLAACKRACGDDPGEQIMVDADHPVKFRPKSAWPETDESRMSKTSYGHGDGFTSVMVTGEVRGADGSHPSSIAVYRMNDSMLLGTEQSIQEDVLYNSTTGRFVSYAGIFAAYSSGADQPEPGPYQTGSAQIRVEAEGYQPLTLQFFDEMPDVVITLSRRSEE